MRGDGIGCEWFAAGITLRINPGFGHGHSQKVNTGGAQSKHGIWHEQLEDCIERATKHKLSITGLHMHIGSGTDLEHLSQVCGAMEKAAIRIGSSILSISAGGGLPVPYRKRDRSSSTSPHTSSCGTRRGTGWRRSSATRFRWRSNRADTWSPRAAILISEIRAIKTAGENTFYLLDAGFNNLARPILYGAYHPMAICPADGKAGESRPPQEVIVGGPLCESGDIFTQEEGGFVTRRPLPEAKVGDFLVIGCAGAYGYAMGSNYNSKPLVAEVLIENGKPHLVRRRQTLDELIQHEAVVR